MSSLLQDRELPDAGSPASPDGPSAVAVGEVTPFVSAVALIALVAEFAIAGAAYSRLIGIAPSLLLHLTVVIAIVVAISAGRKRGGDLSALLLVAMAVATGGPFGAVIAFIGLIGLARPAESSALLDGWYQRIGRATSNDPAVQLSDRIAADRVMRTDAPPPTSFFDLMDTGSLAEQQSALGLVARHFDTRYLPTLARALRADTPVLRVQAAAVAAHVRPHLDQIVADALVNAERLRGLPERATSISDRLRLVHALEDAARSGLADPDLARRAQAAAAALLQPLDPVTIPLSAKSSVHQARLLEPIERRLLDAGDYRGLRLLRRRVRLAAKGFGKVRRMPRRVKGIAQGAVCGP